jgi:hypothetical protein
LQQSSEFSFSVITMMRVTAAFVKHDYISA